LRQLFILYKTIGPTFQMISVIKIIVRYRRRTYHKLNIRKMKF
jgi:hypothetical protein